jgi:hypothetical protein
LGRRIGQAGRRVGGGERFVANGLRAVVVEARQIQQVAEHAQHLPRRPRLADRLDDAEKTLHRAFGIDEGARRLGERRNRKQHVGVVDRGVTERRHRHHQASTLQRGARSRRVGTVVRGLTVQQPQRIHGLRQHLPSMQP